MQDFKEYQIWNGVTPKAITSSTNATPSVLTVASHGFNTGDLVQVFGHATNTAVNGIYQVVKLSANTFSLQNYNTGADIAGNGVGGATGNVIAAPKIAVSQSYDTAVLEVGTTGTATMTVKAVGAQGKAMGSGNDQHGDTPNFGAVQSATNNWTYLQLIQLSDNDSVDGSTGIVTSATDINNVYQVNIDKMKYITMVLSSWTQGAIYAKLTLYKMG